MDMVRFALAGMSWGKSRFLFQGTLCFYTHTIEAPKVEQVKKKEWYTSQGGRKDGVEETGEEGTRGILLFLPLGSLTWISITGLEEIHYCLDCVKGLLEVSPSHFLFWIFFTSSVESLPPSEWTMSKTECLGWQLCESQFFQLLHPSLLLEEEGLVIHKDGRKMPPPAGPLALHVTNAHVLTAWVTHTPVNSTNIDPHISRLELLFYQTP